jgi:hypothetical protein
MTMDDDDVGRREVNMNKSSLKKILTPSQSPAHPCPAVFFIAPADPYPSGAIFPGIPVSCMTKINQCINQFKVYI